MGVPPGGQPPVPPAGAVPAGPAPSAPGPLPLPAIADEFFRLQAQVAFLDLLSGSMRGDLRAFYLGLIDREAP
jgi:hypothetical protein